MLADFLLTLDAVLLGAVLAVDAGAWRLIGMAAQFVAFGIVFLGLLTLTTGALAYMAGLIMGAPG